MSAVTKTKKASAGKKPGVLHKVKSGVKTLKRIAAEVKAERKEREKAKRKKTTASQATKKSEARPKRKITARTVKTGKTKAGTSHKTAKRAQKPKLPPVELSHGEDLHLIPVVNDFNAARIKDSKRIEKIVHHNQEVLMHQENNRVKQAMASRKNIKGMFRNFRQS